MERRQGGQAERMSKLQKRRPEILCPGRKLQTPIEKKATTLAIKADRDRWTALMAQPLNKWKLIK
ncbi:hypothetical protein UFOVP583_30 [uncultured Caudovirales phage]|uniref:Uncharacterized protein n=1 Tax=uncultured Caudovirales phage TaxID=2100421 RepID=A0A6J5N2W8_9CAUD|nr:hypothetical protein UFOVP583_30 [uncultured Caudovirales phage]